MNVAKTFYPKNSKEWRRWLTKNFEKEKEIWLVHYTKASGKESISYQEALDEALCFGWIDSIVKKIDSKKRAQRYTPRRANSPISELNKERLRRLVKSQKVNKVVLFRIKHELNKEFVFPKDILEFIKKNKESWKNFQEFPDYYKVIRIAFIEGARKRPEEFERRLNNFIKMTSKNKKFGMIT
ncbi:MAG: hypothetical protein A2684_02070 [Candidatus Levybacteria bacterium RIFCSPHIGHO2_01_FULL_36_15b]|nr:MAG: hypothetical protein A2684_02070 [Candidatus Levybacteria bacterium RIFCSPHIGHO2_01_FULL_36_15b]